MHTFYVIKLKWRITSKEYTPPLHNSLEMEIAVYPSVEYFELDYRPLLVLVAVYMWVSYLGGLLQADVDAKPQLQPANLEEKITRLLGRSKWTCCEILKRLRESDPALTRKVINSRLYSLLARGQLKKHAGPTSAPLWSK